MARTVAAVTVGLLVEGDVVASAQCIAIDADSFPYQSARFGKRSASAVVWVARIDGAPSVVGFLAGQTRGGRFEIDGLAVRRDARRRGVGRALLGAALAAARTRGLRMVLLHVSVKNDAAIALYEAEGFVIRRRLRDFYTASAFGDVRDAYEMIHLLGAPRR